MENPGIDDNRLPIRLESTPSPTEFTIPTASYPSLEGSRGWST